jgi:hypothetical protein
MPLIKADFKDSIETRRLFWCYAYMLEMNLAVDQLRWIYDGHYMPWEFLQDISRHLWDESRHGDSGHSRLLDFGLSIGDVGFCSYDQEEEEALAADPSAVPTVESLSPRSLYMTVYNDPSDANYAHYQKLLGIMRAKQPLSNAETCPSRSPLPM